MKIIELRNGLGDLQRMLDSFGVKKQAAEFQALIDALAEFDDLTVLELVKRIKAINPSAGKKQAGRIDEIVVEEGLQKLQDAMHMAETFDVAVDSVLKDKRLKQGELLELARRFGGSTPTRSTKPAVAVFLKERRLEMKRQGGLSATIDKMLGRTGS